MLNTILCREVVAFLDFFQNELVHGLFAVFESWVNDIIFMLISIYIDSILVFQKFLQFS
jgi:hypothetical protein